MVSPSPKLRVAIIGLGMVADAHGRALSDLADKIEVSGVFAPNAERREQFAQKFGWHAASSADDLMDDPAIDALLLLTPPNARLDYVRHAAAMGKHVLVEKPLERDSAAAEEIVSLCEKAGVRLGVVFQHRFRAAAMELKRLVAAGETGALHSFQVSVPWWRPQSYYDQPGRGTYARDGGGVLISQAIHTLDLMVSLIGLPAKVQAVAGTTPDHRMEAEDFVGAGMRFDNGALGSLTATTAAFPGRPESISLAFDKVSALLEGGELRLWWRDGKTETIGEPAGTGGGADPMAFPHDWHRELIADFADAVRSGREPAIPGREALKTHRLIDALVRSSAEGKSVRLQKD